MINNNMTTYDFYKKEYERKLTKQIYTQPYYDDLLVITNFLPENSHYAERIYCLLNDMKERPVCEHCGGFVRFPHHLRKEEREYRRFCSTTCSNNNVNVQKEKSKTCMANYGVDNPSKSEEVHNKKVKTIMKNYGGFLMASPIIREQISKKYGKNHSKISYQKGCKTKIERYGSLRLSKGSYSKIATKYIEKFIKNNKIDHKLCLYGSDEMKIDNNYDTYFFDLIVFKTIKGFDDRDINKISHILEYDGDMWHPTIDQSITYRDQPMPISKKKYREKYLKDLKKRIFAMKLMSENNGLFHHIKQTNKKRKLP
jgi:hypothetical protein